MCRNVLGIGNETHLLLGYHSSKPIGVSIKAKTAVVSSEVSAGGFVS